MSLTKKQNQYETDNNNYYGLNPSQSTGSIFRIKNQNNVKSFMHNDRKLYHKSAEKQKLAHIKSVSTLPSLNKTSYKFNQTQVSFNNLDSRNKLNKTPQTFRMQKLQNYGTAQTKSQQNLESKSCYIDNNSIIEANQMEINQQNNNYNNNFQGHFLTESFQQQQYFQGSDLKYKKMKPEGGSQADNSTIYNFSNMTFLPPQQDLQLQKTQEDLDEKDKLLLKKLTSNNNNDNDVQNFEEDFKYDLNSQDDFPNFYKHYKKINKISDVTRLNKTQVSPFLGLFEKSTKVRQIPKINNIVSQNGPNKKIKTQHFRIGDKNGQYYSEGISAFNDKVEDLNLAYNNLTDQSAKKIILSLNKKVVLKINLSYNKIGLSTCSALSDFLHNSLSVIKNINLEGNSLGNKGASLIIESIIEGNSSLKSLNLSKNQINHKIGPEIKQLLLESLYLQELYLHWNELGNEGFKYIGEALVENRELKVLDLSYNSIGRSIENMQLWAQVIQRDSDLALVHLDFSYNKFTQQESEILQEALNQNHSLYGFHYRGNVGRVSSKGFLQIKQSDQKIQDQLDLQNNRRGEWCLQSRIDNVKVVKKHTLQNYLNNCWICEGWREMEFKFFPYVSAPAGGPVVVHFSFDNYQPHLMYENDKGEYEFKKMCPPNYKIQYFFTIKNKHYIAQDQDKNQNKYQTKIKIQFADVCVTANMPELNYVHSADAEQIMDHNTYEIKTDIKPRQYEPVNFLAPVEEVKIPWCFENSIFKTYKRDDEELLNKCFEFDWSCCKIERILKPYEIESVKEIFKKNYPLIKNNYKNFASTNPTGEIWSLSSNVYADMFTQAGIVDLNYGLKDADFNFIATNSGLDKWKQQNNPQRAAIRFQYMELFLRNINDKYIKTKYCENFTDALHQVFGNGLTEFLISTPFEHDWKQNVYWCENNDLCLQKYQKIIQYIYKKYAGSKNKELLKIKYINLEEFKYFVVDSQVFVGDLVTEREINQAFNLAVMTQVDEINKSRHMQLQLVEFYESLTRLADALSPVPYQEEEAEWPIEKRKQLPLHIKLESLLLLLNVRYGQTDRFFRDDNPLPQKSMYAEEIQNIKQGKQQLTKQSFRVRKSILSVKKQNQQSRKGMTSAEALQFLQQQTRRGSQMSNFNDSTPNNKQTPKNGKSQISNFSNEIKKNSSNNTPKNQNNNKVESFDKYQEQQSSGQQSQQSPDDQQYPKFGININSEKFAQYKMNKSNQMQEVIEGEDQNSESNNNSQSCDEEESVFDINDSNNSLTDLNSDRQSFLDAKKSSIRKSKYSITEQKK